MPSDKDDTVKSLSGLDPSLAEDLRELSNEEFAHLQKMLQSMHEGDTSRVKAFLAQDYEEAVVPIERFINDDKYLGRPLKSPQGDSLVYEYWHRALTKIANSNAIEIILTGPIGSGKSTVVDIYMAYIMHQMLCLKDPFDYYELVRAQPISLLFFSLSKDLSGVGLFKGFMELITSSPWFKERGVLTGGHRNQILRFPHKNIDYTLGSPRMPGQGIVGRNVIAGGLDEISEVTSAKELEKGSNQDFAGMKSLQIYEKVARRMESRFLQGGRQPGKLFLVSSKQDQAAFIERYIEKVKGSPHVLIFDDPIWEIKPKKNFSGITFDVAVGDEFKDSFIMKEDDDVDELEEQGYDVIEVPEEYRRSFDLDVNGALRDIAGISAASTRQSKLIARADYLKRCINPDLSHPFTKKIIYLSNERGDDTGIEDYFIMRDEFRTSPYRFIHVDLGLNGDAAGMSMCHVKGVKEVEKQMEDGTFLNMRDHIVRFDFTVRIKNVQGADIPFWKIRRFIIYLRRMKVRIAMITFDGWQSIDARQLLEHAGFTTELLSMDKNDGPYMVYRNAVYEERAEYYEYEPLITESKELIHMRRKKKVDHPIEGSKDVSDSAAGCLYKALEAAGNQPSPEKTVSALREMESRKAGGMDPKWWLRDLL